MSNFTRLDLPVFDNLLDELNKIVRWDDYGQICLNAPRHDADNHQAGQGSLIYDWDRSERIWNETTGSHDWVVPPRETPLKETDFTVTTECFRGTVFEELLGVLKDNYQVGRVRIMKLKPKSCLTWHQDDTARVHYPFLTNEGCKMIIDDEVRHMPANTWWHTETTKFHTAINASRESRLHVVAVLL